MSDARHGYFFQDLEAGMTGLFGKTVTEADIVLFSGISGDTNPLHLDAGFAGASRFGQRIAHGMLTASFISAVLGTRLPGPGCIYLGQSLKFLAPVRIGDTVLARVVVDELIPERHRARLRTQCLVGETLVVDGDALVYVPPRRGGARPPVEAAGHASAAGTSGPSRSRSSAGVRGPRCAEP
jgi:3-hydroxybutyryl-CoA dehydratase